MGLKFLFVLFALHVAVNASAQDCFEYYKNHCSPPKSKFNYAENIQSASFLFNSGELRRIPFTLLQKKDYRITICGADVFEGIIKFEIRNESGKSLYDNSAHNFLLSTEFSNKKDQDVYFEITAPEPAAGISDTVYVEGCIGILIEEMNSVKTGF
jgi:hypothetical protein